MMRMVNTRAYTLGLLTLVYTFSVLDRFILGILLPDIKQELALNDTLLGLLTGAAFAIFYATLAVPIARLAERMSRKIIISLSLALFSVMTALCGLANSFWILFLARIGVGVGEAGTTPSATSILSDLYPIEKRSGAVAIMSVGGNLGVLIGFIVGGFVASEYGWRAAFFVIGLPGILLALTILWSMPEPQRGAADGQTTSDAPPDFKATLSFLWQQKTYVWIVVALTLMVGMTTSLITWLPSFLTRSHGMATNEVGLVLGLSIGLLGPIGTIFVGGFLVDRLTLRDRRWGLWVSALGALVLVPAYLALVMASSAHAAVLAYGVPALLGIFFQGPSLALMQAVTPVAMRATGTAISLFVVNLIGLGLGPLSIGLVSDALAPSYGADSLRYALLVGPALALAAAFVYQRAATCLVDDIDRADAFSQNPLTPTD